MKRLLAVALLSTVVATPVFAAESGAYIGVTVGSSKTDNPYPGNTVTKDTDTVGSILAGYQYNKNLGVEVFYAGVGKLEANCGAGCSASIKGDAVGINVVGTAPISDMFALYAKLGYASTKTDVSVTGVAGTGNRHSALTGGVGGQYNVTKDVGIRLGWDGYEESATIAGVENKPRSNVWSMGAVFRF